MCKWIYCLLVLAGIEAMRGTALAEEAKDGRAETVGRLETVMPVTAWGAVEPNELIAIKSKASGRVQDVCVQEGQMVRAGAVLVQLDPSDEQRTVERLQADLDRARAGCEQAKIRLKEARENRPLDIEAAEKTVDQARATRDELQIDVDRLGELASDLKNQTEEKKAQIALARASAVLAHADVDLRRAKNNLPIVIASAEQDVAAAEALVRSTQKQVDEARERLADTIILAPIDSLVFSLNVRRGEVIQSGTFGLSGGALLAQLADVSKMYVLAQVDAAQIGAVRRIAPPFAQPGKSRTISDEELFGPPAGAARAPAASPAPHHVKITAEAFPDEIFDGVIERILPEPHKLLDCSAFDVRIRVVGADIVRLLCLPVHVDFATDRKKCVVRVPSEALVQDGRDCFIFCPAPASQNPAEQEKKVKVRVGPTDGAFTEIVSGLAAGDRIWVRRPKPHEQKEPMPAPAVLGTLVGAPAK